MIKAVIFDIDGVLLNSFEANLKFFNDLLIKFGYSGTTGEEFRGLFHHPMKEIIRVLSKSESDDEIEKIWKAGVVREVRYPLELLVMPEKIEETLIALSENYSLGIVTSRVRSGIYEMPQLAELQDYFKVVVGYEDTDKHKPDPDPLILATEKFNLSPDECVYVGDGGSDIIAAKSAGMKAVLYAEIIHLDADANISIFTDLPDIIKNL